MPALQDSLPDGGLSVSPVGVPREPPAPVAHCWLHHPLHGLVPLDEGLGEPVYRHRVVVAKGGEDHLVGEVLVKQVVQVLLICKLGEE